MQVFFRHVRLDLLKLVIILVAGYFMQPAALAQPLKITLPNETTWIAIEASPSAPPVRTSTTTISPEMGKTKDATELENAGATASDRVIVGAGDQIFIAVFGQPDMSAEVTINDNGQVTLPLIGTLKIGDLSPQAIERLVAKRLRDGEYLRSPEVSVQVRQLRSQIFSVLGEVQRPGRFPLQGRLTVLDALATAGGVTTRADRIVFLIRRNHAKGTDTQRQEIAIELDQLVDKSRGDVDLELKNEDVVFVAQQKFFYIHGEVRRPGAYPMEPDLNLMRAISLGGGVTERGSIKRIRIHRQQSDKKITEFKPELIAPIQNGDVIYVDERLF
jgi:polysaccharide export outer membrane protein